MGIAAMNCFIHPMCTRIFQVKADTFIRGQVLILDSFGIDQGPGCMTNGGNRFVLIGKILNDPMCMFIETEGVSIDCTTRNVQNIVVLYRDLF